MTKELLEQRNRAKKKKPTFMAQDIHKKKRIGRRWNKPRGIDSKMRLGLSGYRRCPSHGFGSPKAVYGVEPKTGLNPIVVFSVSALSSLNAEVDGVVVGSSVGQRKKVDILKEANSKNLKVLNVKDVEAYLKLVEEIVKKKKEDKEKTVEVKKEKVKEREKKAEEKEAEDKKDDKKEEKSEGGDALADKIKEAEVVQESEKEEKKKKDKTLTKKDSGF